MRPHRRPEPCREPRIVLERSKLGREEVRRPVVFADQKRRRLRRQCTRQRRLSCADLAANEREHWCRHGSLLSNELRITPALYAFVPRCKGPQNPFPGLLYSTRQPKPVRDAMTDWNLPWEGGCMCGRIRFRITAAPLLTMACHCTGCQKLSASAFSLSIAVPSEGFTLTQGEPELGGMHSEHKQFYCPHCKNWVLTRPHG